MWMKTPMVSRTGGRPRASPARSMPQTSMNRNGQDQTSGTTIDRCHQVDSPSSRVGRCGYLEAAINPGLHEIKRLSETDRPGDATSGCDRPEHLPVHPAPHPGQRGIPERGR